MLYEVLQVGAGLSLAIVVGFYLYLIAVAHVTYVSFRKKSKGLPMLPERRLIGNHLRTWVLGKNQSSRLASAHKQLGKTVGMLYNHRYGASTVDLDLIKLMIRDEPGEHNDRLEFETPLEEIQKSLLLINGDSWRRTRRAFAPALKSNKFKHPNVMREIESSIERVVEMIDSKLEEKAMARGEGHKFHIDDLVHRYSLNLMFSCFYKQTNLINFDDQACHWAELADGGYAAFQNNPLCRAPMLFPPLRSIIDWLIYNFHPQGTARKTMMQFVKMQTKLGIEARKHAEKLRSQCGEDEQVDTDNFVLEDGTKFSRNMIDHVIDQFIDGKLTKDEYFSTACLLMTAADKTSSDNLVHTLYQLSANQDIQERLRKSLQDEGAESEYLDWVLKESLRLFPPVTGGCARVVSRDIQIEGGFVVPKDTFVVTNAFVIHRLKEYWGEDADEFKPERWADTNNHHPMQYIPFGAGPRVCPGKEFALFEHKLLLTTLFTRYKFECAKNEHFYSFDSPCFVFLIPHTQTYVTIKKLAS